MMSLYFSLNLKMVFGVLFAIYWITTAVFLVNQVTKKWSFKEFPEPTLIVALFAPILIPWMLIAGSLDVLDRKINSGEGIGLDAHIPIAGAIVLYILILIVANTISPVQAQTTHTEQQVCSCSK